MTLRHHIEKSMAFLALIVVGTGCSTCNYTRKDAGTLEVGQRPLSLSEALTEKDRREAEGWAEYAKGILLQPVKPEEAQAHFAKALALLPDSLKALNAAMSPLLNGKKLDKAIEVLGPIVLKNPKSLHVNVLYAHIQAERKRLPEAVSHLQKCCEATDYSMLEMASPLVGYLVAEKRFKDAEGVLRRLEGKPEFAGNMNLIAEQAVFWHSMMVVAVESREGKDDDAAKAALPPDYTKENCERNANHYVERLRGCKIDSLKSLALAGDLFSTFGRWDLMWEMLEGIKDEKLRDTVAYISMRLDAMNKRGDKEAYRQYALGFMKEEHLVPNFTVKLAQCFQGMKDYKNAIMLVQRLLARMPSNVDFKRWLAQLFISDKQLDSAIQIYNSMHELQAPDEYVLSYIWREKGDLEKAYNAISAAEKKGEGNKEFLDMNFYFSFAIICEKRGMVDEAIKRSRQAYELDKDSAAACNFYGYMLADYNREVPFAKALITKALKAEPDNAAYLDSMAWACFRLAEYKSAFEFIMKALANGGMDEDGDGVIAKHAAEICRKNGFDELAENYFRIAAVCE